ncbi:hypothetical protein [Paraburkholderia sp. BCC1886]|uniref:hypothetical protein n=1 Tax=Paraburkholderia sp. BCC1886 TaxID=2562670 RepID=UPI001182D07B|nr:hypothetical protein [Paraburkholderia sp. BCC1886]
MIIRTIPYKGHQVQQVLTPEQTYWQALLLDREGPGYAAIRSKTEAAAKRRISLHLKRQGIPLDELIRIGAWRMRRVSVEVDELRDVVSIGPDIALFGDEAAEFISDARHLWESAQIVTEDQCYAFLAEPIYETLSN